MFYVIFTRFIGMRTASFNKPTPADKRPSKNLWNHSNGMGIIVSSVFTSSVIGVIHHLLDLRRLPSDPCTPIYCKVHRCHKKTLICQPPWPLVRLRVKICLATIPNIHGLPCMRNGTLKGFRRTAFKHFFNSLMIVVTCITNTLKALTRRKKFALKIDFSAEIYEQLLFEKNR